MSIQIFQITPTAFTVLPSYGVQHPTQMRQVMVHQGDEDSRIDLIITPRDGGEERVLVRLASMGYGLDFHHVQATGLKADDARWALTTEKRETCLDEDQMVVVIDGEDTTGWELEIHRA